ncbi:MAG: gamma-glutamyltransferase [Chromatiales bacterium]
MRRVLKAPHRGLFIALLLLAQPSLHAGEAGIASAHPLATEAGFEILQQGGNAFDAAVAVSAALAVVEPYSSGIGGGGFWLLQRQSDGLQVMVDSRERAPGNAQRDMYLDADGNVVKGLSVDGPLAAGIPGEPAALAHIAEKYGQLPLATSLAPAIRLANEGFAVDDYYRRMAGWRLDALRASPTAANVFLHNNEVPENGFLIKQPDLANTLQALADQGRAGFYAGEVAQKLVTAVQRSGGIWTQQDLSSYRVIEREPVRIRYHDMQITTAALPSSGGVVLAQMFNMLERFDLGGMSEAQRVHLLIEVMRRAYRDRARFLGDSDYVSVDVVGLTSKDYARQLAADIDPKHASTSQAAAAVEEGHDTTHFSIIDSQGNRVAATLSINYPFGSGFVADGTGVLLNDEMDDFSARPGSPNVYGLVGNEANAIAPGKRMLSSMSPTFVDGPQGVAVLGTPGGSRIISMVLLAVLQMDHSLQPQDWVSRPRLHHQYLPDVVQFEPKALSEQLQQQLREMGHKLQPLDHDYGNMQALFYDRQSGKIHAASDPRGIGQALVKPLSATAQP